MGCDHYTDEAVIYLQSRILMPSATSDQPLLSATDHTIRRLPVNLTEL